MSRMVDLLIDLHNGAQPAATSRMIAALAPAPAVIQPRDPRTYLSLLLDRYIRHLSAEGVPDPLGQQLTLAGVVYDLCMLAECPVPAAVVELLGGGR